MVRMEFPWEMLEPAFLDALIRESSEDFIMKARLEAAQREEGPLRPYFEAAAYASGGSGGGAASYGYSGYVGGFKVRCVLVCLCTRQAVDRLSSGLVCPAIGA